MKLPFTLIVIAVMSAFSAQAALDSSRVTAAEPKKTQIYVREGLIVGGDRAVTDTTVKDLRRASNAGFERIVIDFETAATPFYQVALEPELKRIVFTLHARSRLGLKPNQIHALFKKSPLVSRVELFPRLDDETWSFALHLKSAVPVEVFELRAPTRVILDLKTAGGPQASVSKPAAKARKAAPRPEDAGSEGGASYEHQTFESDSAPE